MSSATDDDILHDFLTEAGELVQRLGEQLVDLEARPGDQDLLNAIFRAFHTVKGGAGFLNLGALVELCHAAEDVFNRLRGGQIAIDPGLMDAVLESVDQVQAMMAQVSAHADPTPAPPDLIARLHDYAAGKAAARPKAEAAPAPKPAPKAEPKPVAAAPANPDTITEDEFEALLDQLQGRKPAAPAAPAAPPEPPAPAPVAEVPRARPAPPPTPAAAPAAETSVRVDTAKLDKTMNLVGELVLVRNRMKALRAQRGADESLARAISELDFITRGLQNAVMQIRMQPIRKVFSRFPKLARDVARSLDKQVEVELRGEDTDLDKTLVEALADPLVHMVRNSVDHGIEMPDLRVARGKPPAGQLKLEARQEGDHIRITVRDDGGGIDPERVRTKVVEKKLMDAAAAARLSHEECL
ncbi:MAG TPA: Hpt domain-containing protein, partial [Solimonas sp.]|nr:Hpt domain-containing protein [Solimonas sp.]